jgi:hypothetical protein
MRNVIALHQEEIKIAAAPQTPPRTALYDALMQEA